MALQDWRSYIAQLVFVKEKLHEVDSKKLWPYHLPALAATEEELRTAEAVIGERLDEEYRGFLSCAGGWRAFYQECDLFGPGDLIGSPRFAHAMEMLSYVEPAILATSGFRTEELIPIAASSEDLDLFVITRRSTSKPGIVIWLAGDEVDRFPSFEEYFLAMVDYNRAAIEAMISRS